MLKMQAEKKGGGRNVPVVGGEPGEPVKDGWPLYAMLEPQ